MNFYKYQGTGNDFVIIDNRENQFLKDPDYIQHLCDRRFGVGADGLILLENDAKTDFRMVYYNADGYESTMCGNGGRCIVAFAAHLNIITDTTTFIAIDGLHEARMNGGMVKLKMSDVESIENGENCFVLNTGSPHHVAIVEEVENYDVFTKGNKIRNSATYRPDGINVNFAEQISEDELFVRTYERGVEDETLSCGTGATAAALSFMQNQNLAAMRVKVRGGNLKVYAEKHGQGFRNIWLEGPATLVFEGSIN